MTPTSTAPKTQTIRVDQYVPAPPEQVWRMLTESELLRMWLAGAGTRVFLEHSGFDLNDKRMADAHERMGTGWRDVVLPRLAASAVQV
jgi:uncharacterized protein YndB with AHSA1/START domain